MGSRLASLVGLLVLVGCDVATPPRESVHSAAVITPTVRKVAIVMLKLSGDTTEPNTVAEARAIAFTGTYSTRALFLEWSFGNLSIEGKTGPNGDVFGWYSIPTSGCNLAQFVADASAAAQVAGDDLTGYDSIVYTWNSPACTGGSASQNGSVIFMSPQNFHQYGMVLAHEVGHNMNLQHSGSYACVDALGNPVTLSTNCTVVNEYGDSFDVMGPNPPNMAAFHKEQLGWLDTANKLTVTSSGDYTITPLEQVSAGVQGLRIPRRNDPAHDLYFDFRQPFGFDNYFPNNPVVLGPQIRLVPTVITAIQPLLLDATPGTPTDFTDGTLQVGQTFDDFAAGVHVTTLAVAPTGATIRVTIDPPPVVDAPPDAYVPDAYVPDAYVPPDAFVPDAFVPDAYVPDAYVPDAAIADASSVDGAQPDAPGGAGASDDDSGCCSGGRPRAQHALLAAAVLLVVRRRRRRVARAA